MTNRGNPLMNTIGNPLMNTNISYSGKSAEESLTKLLLTPDLRNLILKSFRKFGKFFFANIYIYLFVQCSYTSSSLSPFHMFPPTLLPFSD